VRVFWLIARHEYLRNVRRRSFLGTTFGLPLFMIVMTALSILAGSLGGGDVSHIGYVDESGVLASLDANPGFRAFANRAEATEALEAKNIQAFYVLPANYTRSGSVELVYWDRRPSPRLSSRFETFLREGLVKGLSPQVAKRVLAGSARPVVRTLDGRQESGGSGLAGVILPFAFGLFISFALMSASGYLMRAISDERENRTIEVMTTSVSPGQLVAGKAVGLVGVALTQVALWAIVAVVAFTVASRFVASLAGIEIPWSLLGVLAAFFVPLFVLAASLVIVLGVVVTDSRQGQGVAGFIGLLFLLPLFLSPLIADQPNGPAMVAFTLFPTTSLLTIAVRWAATAIPLWQLASSWLILACCAWGSLWLAPRVFRRGMLRYGQRMSFRSLVDAARGRD
jgi:ABC-2 type transport system permease protein